MAKKDGIDFGVLNPETTEVFGAPDGFHVLLRDKKGGPREWPYRPEVLRRRNGTTRAALAVTVRIKPEVVSRIREGSLLHHPDFGPKMRFYDAIHRLAEQGVVLEATSLELVLIKMLRPATPQGFEWNAPGGIVKLTEDPERGMLREFREEAKGMRVLAATTLFSGVQFSSGVYYEMYDIGVVLTVGDPEIDPREGAVGWKTVDLDESIPFCEQASKVATDDPAYCAVDGKVLMALWYIVPQVNIVTAVFAPR